MIILPIYFIHLAVTLAIEDEAELKVIYHEELIKAEIKRAEKYEFPKSNFDYFKNLKQDIEDFGRFDFIIVGAGSSGSAVASRLSEVESFRILLLEAGDWDDELTSIPYMSVLLHKSRRNWGYYTTSQNNGCHGWKGRKCPYQRGKVVGGSGSINGMAYVRGNRGDYDNWASLGNIGWSFEEVLPYFKKMENFNSEKIDHDFRGFAGPLNSNRDETEEYFEEFRNVFMEMGLKIIDDYNAKKQIGASKNQRFIKSGKRVSGATAYLRPSITRHNFNITVNALVTKILINETTKIAYGVEFVKNGQTFRAMSKKEVILSAGAINTPQLLMLSGIGPNKELKKHNIPPIKNLPVGEQLKDHFLLRLSYKINSNITYVSLTEAIREYLNGEGILTRPANEFGFNFINTKNESSTLPNIEISFYYPSPLNQTIPCICNFTDEFMEYQSKLAGTLNMGIFLLFPKSSGTLKLKSKNILDHPLIDSGLLSDVEDMEVLYEGIKFITQIETTEYAKKHNLKLVTLPICEQYKNSKDYWFCAFRYLTNPGLHVSSTAKMAPMNDPFAVVDYKLRVYGIKALRVVDCSIMPTPISGHTNTVAFMIGEKAAAILKSEY